MKIKAAKEAGLSILGCCQGQGKRSFPPLEYGKAKLTKFEEIFKEDYNDFPKEKQAEIGSRSYPLLLLFQVGRKR